MLGTKYDAGISSFTITEERMQEANMIAFLNAGSAYAVASGNPDDIDPESLCGVTVAVQTGTVQDEDIAVQSQACTDAGEEKIDILQYDSQSDATTNVAGGKAQVLYADSPVIGYAVEQTGGQLEQLGDVFDSAPQGVVVAKDDTELAAAIQAALQSLMDSGQLEEILGPGAAATPPWRRPSSTRPSAHDPLASPRPSRRPAGAHPAPAAGGRDDRADDDDRAARLVPRAPTPRGAP